MFFFWLSTKWLSTFWPFPIKTLLLSILMASHLLDGAMQIAYWDLLPFWQSSNPSGLRSDTVLGFQTSTEPSLQLSFGSWRFVMLRGELLPAAVQMLVGERMPSTKILLTEKKMLVLNNLIREWHFCLSVFSVSSVSPDSPRSSLSSLSSHHPTLPLSPHLCTLFTLSPHINIAYIYFHCRRANQRCKHFLCQLQTTSVVFH